MVELSSRFASEGLVIMAFPCNQFLCQEPGGRDSIAKGAASRRFEPPAMVMMDKVNVSDGRSGEAHPAFSYLCQTTRTKISWNFGAYFLVAKTGEVQGFAGVSPNKLTDNIAALCKA